MSAELERIKNGIIERDPRAVARACRLVDDRNSRRLELLAALHDRVGHAKTIGITGTGGAGKSTLVDQLIAVYRKRGLRVAVLAVDPSSPFSGGAILGDRIRMQRHFLDEGVFIRSLATRGHVGGLSRSVVEVMRIVDAAGFDVVIVETVGVGQDELEVANLTDTTVVVLAPGLGDDIQAMKAGILEIADIFVVNKADRRGADSTVQDIRQMLSLRAMRSGAAATSAGHSAAASFRKGPEPVDGRWNTPVLKTVASEGEGVDELIHACDEHAQHLLTTDEGKLQRSSRQRALFRSIAQMAWMEQWLAQNEAKIELFSDEVSETNLDPFVAAYRLVQNIE
ncbi:MAG: methylmalonyl Co-A mutase-associated GTPase MeaB [Polyangiales bacterium]